MLSFMQYIKGFCWLNGWITIILLVTQILLIVLISSRFKGQGFTSTSPWSKIPKISFIKIGTFTLYMLQEGNRYADLLTKLGTSSSIDILVYLFPPACVSDLHYAHFMRTWFQKSLAAPFFLFCFLLSKFNIINQLYIHCVNSIF